MADLDRTPAPGGGRARAGRGPGWPWCGSGSARGGHGRAGGSRRPRPAPRAPVGARPTRSPRSRARDRIGLRSTFTHRGYLDAVARVREYIVAGDIFQANLSQRFQAPLREAPFELYRRLRRRNPAPFAAYLDFGDLHGPERLARAVSPAGRARRQVETRPIKGTRPRGLGPMHDAALGRALAESEKDRAENVMIVDLLRNDLSRVCRPGTRAGAGAVRAGAPSDGAPPGLHRRGRAATRRGCRGSAAGDLSRRLHHRRAQGPGHGDHRRAGADSARRVLRLGRLPERHRGHGHQHRDPNLLAGSGARYTSRPAAASWPTRIPSWSTGRRWTRRGR